MQKERCGIILKGFQFIEVPNIAPDPYNFCAWETHHLSATDIIGTWHTHPNTTPNLSCEDYRLFSRYPYLKHYIIAEKETWSFFMEDGVLLCNHNEDDCSTRLP